MTIRDELLALTDPEDGMIHAARAVTWARRNPNSELYQEFEWDDEKAAKQHRLNQARRLIEVHIVYPNTGQRQTVSLTVDRTQGGGYRQLEPVLNNATMRSILIRQILDEMARVIDRYPQLSEISPLRSAIEMQRRALELPLAAD